MGQLIQVVCLYSLLKVPGLHFKHFPIPSLFVYVPGIHSKHSDEEPIE